MDARKYLEQVRHIDEEIQSRMEEQESLKASLVSSPQINEDSVTSSPKGHYDDKFVKIVEYSQDIDERVDKLFALKHEISSAIDEVDDQLYRLILRERYINIKNWEQIEDQLHYSHRQIIRLHGEALESFRKVYNMAQNGT